ncbi:hypothetical protein DXG01_006147 [Tephrocybe rancida]|nr:hypothetical protein DXG01_006147 [Tephrocybe rancida]
MKDPQFVLKQDNLEALQQVGLRKIRNIEFNYEDVSAVVEDQKKITGTTINAFGAVLQQQADDVADDTLWCIFSTWLGDLIQDHVSARAVGTFEEHVHMACSLDTTEVLLARTCWLVPICGGSPLHWVLGWINYSTTTIFIFDSIPELESTYWAEPLLLQIVDEIRWCVKAKPIKWSEGGWKHETVSPTQLECQFDNWSCGLFVMMAICAATGQCGWDEVSDSRKNSIRPIMLDALVSVEKAPLHGASGSTGKHQRVADSDDSVYDLDNTDDERKTIKQITQEKKQRGPKKIELTRSIAQIFASVTEPIMAKAQPHVLCRNLTGKEHKEYVLRSRTRRLGGISPAFRARSARQIFPYKPFPAMKADSVPVSTGPPVKHETPDWGNKKVEGLLWTSEEKLKLESTLRAWARWEVDTVANLVRSAHCKRMTNNKNEICDACASVKNDPSFKRAVKHAVNESKLSVDEQREVLAMRVKHAPHTAQTLEAHTLLKKLEDPVLFDVHRLLKHGQNIDCFLQLYMHAQDGKLKNLDVFQDICEVLVDKLNREESIQPHSASAGRAFGVTFTYFRLLVANSEDTLQNPQLIYENIAKVKRLVDAIGYTGPVSFASDCTKVHPWLTFSNEYGGHVLGSVLPMDACKIQEASDIDDIIDKVKEDKTLSTQVRVYMVKVPLPQIAPLIVVALPTISGGDAEFIHLQQMKVLKMASNLRLPIISFSADGASSELSAQSTMDKQASELPPIVYEYLLYGIFLKAPVFKDTGPLVSITDPPHGRKTCRNQPQNGTHTASLGIGYLVNRSLVDLYGCPDSGLVHRDVENVDKQDDGAARHAFHEGALHSLMSMDSKGSASIKENFEGLFVYLFVFEAFQICRDILKIPASNPTVTVPVDLAPLGSLALQKKVSRSKEGEQDSDDNDINFDSDSEDEGEDVLGSGLSLSTTMAVAAHDTARYAALCEDTDKLEAQQDDLDISNTVPGPAPIASLNLSISVDDSTSKPTPRSDLFDGSGKRTVKLNPKFEAAKKQRQVAFNESGVEIKMSLKEASHCLCIGQQLDVVLQQDEPQKDREMRWKSIARGVQILIRPEELPNLAVKNVEELFPLRINNFAIFRSAKCTYIGEILDIYKKGASGHYGSVTNVANASSLQAISVRVYLPLGIASASDDEIDDSPIFSCSHGQYHLHTYAHIDTLIYHLGPRVFDTLGNSAMKLKAQYTLKDTFVVHWISLTVRQLPKHYPN